MLGAEMLFNSAVKAAGLNPAEIMEQVKAFAEGTQRIAETIKRIEERQIALDNRLDAIERHIGMSVKPTLTIEGK